MALGSPPGPSTRMRFTGADRLVSCFSVSDLAVASLAAAAGAVGELIALQAPAPGVAVDFRLASLWFGWSIRPVGWELPAPWDAIAGDYRASNGWIKLHTNAPHHRAAALSVLGCEPTRGRVSVAVSALDAEELEAAVVEAGGCAARLRTVDEWRSHAQGATVGDEPLVIWDRPTATRLDRWAPTRDRPLNGLRVLDLTRVIAGPVATRFLAGYGVEVLRIDPFGWDEPAVAPEVLLGKRSARLDLRDPAGRQSFTRLLADCDVLVHGYRSDGLERLGFGADTRQRIRPGLIDVSLDAYGHSGPWEHRRGFDSLVQFSTGIAAEGMAWRARDEPVSLPVQALDHATGYLLAAAVLAAIRSAVVEGRTQRARLSLARTAKLLIDHQDNPSDTPFLSAENIDFASGIEHTGWGPAHRLRPPVQIEGALMRWSRPAPQLGSGQATWHP